MASPVSVLTRTPAATCRSVPASKLRSRDNISLKGQYEYHWDVSESDALATTTDSAHVGKFGFNFHF